ncbi:MAG: hypothetical protein LC775_03095, partial [Acidobacteria bacterium]|nr:hypothetical protein [Acidobacteriota bacterium]
MQKDVTYEVYRNPEKPPWLQPFGIVYVNEFNAIGFITPRSAVRSRPPLPILSTTYSYLIGNGFFGCHTV